MATSLFLLPNLHLAIRICALLVLPTLSILWFFRTRDAASRRNPQRLPYPPGPRPLPIIGNLLDLPKTEEKSWLVYNQMVKQYGDIFHLEVLGQHIVILGSIKRINDIFEKRSAVYSDRIRLVMLNELAGWEFNFTFAHYGDQWRSRRRLFHQEMNVNTVPQYYPVQLREARAFLRRLLATPDQFLHHVRHTDYSLSTFAASIMSIAYGIEVTGPDDAYISTAAEAAESIAEAGTPGAFLVENIPLLKYIPTWFPGATFKKKAARWRNAISAMRDRPYAAVRAAMRDGVAVGSVALTMTENLPDTDAKEEDIKSITSLIYGGGAETTVSAVQSFFLAMAMFPGVQKKAQAEIDRVVGNDRLPEFNDRSSLQYIMAMVKETMRWQPVVPMAVPHASTRDDEYDGYFIPKGSLVIGLSWSILHNPEVYPEPEEFKPERFLKDGQLDPTVQDPNIAAFGYGRRICPGRHMSDNSLFINIASLLAVYNFGPGIDETTGKPVKLKAEITSGILCYPVPFECCIRPRSETAVRLIHESQMEGNGYLPASV